MTVERFSNNFANSLSWFRYILYIFFKKLELQESSSCHQNPRIGSRDVIGSGRPPVQQMISGNKQRGQVATLRWDEQWKISLIGSEKAVRTEVDFVGPLSTLTLKRFMTHESSRAATDWPLDNACWSLPLSSEFIQCDS